MMMMMMMMMKMIIAIFAFLAITPPKMSTQGVILDSFEY